MGWDGFDDHDEDYWDQDYIDYMNKTGIYEEPSEPDDPEDDIYLSGLDPDDLADMDEDDRRDALESVGLDPDDYDDVFIGASSGYRSSSARRTSTVSRTSSTNRTSTVSRTMSTSRPKTVIRSSTPNRQTSSNNGKMGLLEFIVGMTIIGIIGYTVAAFGGELLGAIVVLIIGIYVISQ